MNPSDRVERFLARARAREPELEIGIPRPVERILEAAFPTRLVPVEGLTVQRAHALLASDYGLRMPARRRDEPLDGYTCAFAQAAVVFYDPAVAPGRARFTLGHEASHLLDFIARIEAGRRGGVFLAHRDPRGRIGSPVKRRPPEEVLADAFASELLMPPEDVAVVARRVLTIPGAPIPAQLVKQLAARYGASQQAMAIRLVTLGLAKAGPGGALRVAGEPVPAEA